MPIISVILPVYNGERTIQETIASVLRQTFSDFELIVINDGSQDSTLDIVKRIPDPRLKVLSYPNAGLAASRNRGIAQAVGDYIAFIDADDLWTPDKLEAQFQALQNNPHAALAYSWTDFIDESSQFIHTGSHLTVNGNAYAHLLLVNFLENGSNPLIRQPILTQVAGFDESLSAAEDWDLWLRLAANYPFVCVPKPQILYRVSLTSMTANVTRQKRETLKVIKRAFAQAPESLNYIKQPSMANLYKYFTFKVLEGYPARQNGLQASQFLAQALINDPTLLHKRVIWKVILKIIIVTLLPAQLAQICLNYLQQRANVSALLVHIKTDLSSEELSQLS